MNFSEAWDTLSAGDSVAVSNGDPPPQALADSIPMRVWRSHNFTGTLVEKIDGSPRLLRFNLPLNAEGNTIGFSVAEDVPHAFALA